MSLVLLAAAATAAAAAEAAVYESKDPSKVGSNDDASLEEGVLGSASVLPGLRHPLRLEIQKGQCLTNLAISSFGIQE
jgi:hypothetical protein